MTIKQMAIKSLAVLSSALFLGWPTTSAMAEPIIKDSPVGKLMSTSLISANSATDNCQYIKSDTIILSGSTAIFAQPRETMYIRSDSPPQSILLTLAAPLLLTENCVLGRSVDGPTLIEAKLEKADDVDGLIIKTQSIIVSGHYLSLSAESNVIPFERHLEQASVASSNSDWCDVIGILPNVLMDPYELGGGISTQDLSVMTGDVCEMIFSQPSYLLQAELRMESLYNLRLPGIQSIPVPPALRGFIATE